MQRRYSRCPGHELVAERVREAELAPFLAAMPKSTVTKLESFGLLVSGTLVSAFSVRLLHDHWGTLLLDKSCVAVLLLAASISLASAVVHARAETPRTVLIGLTSTVAAILTAGSGAVLQSLSMGTNVALKAASVAPFLHADTNWPPALYHFSVVVHAWIVSGRCQLASIAPPGGVHGIAVDDRDARLLRLTCAEPAFLWFQRFVDDACPEPSHAIDFTACVVEQGGTPPLPAVTVCRCRLPMVRELRGIITPLVLAAFAAALLQAIVACASWLRLVAVMRRYGRSGTYNSANGRARRHILSTGIGNGDDGGSFFAASAATPLCNPVAAHQHELRPSTYGTNK